MSIVNHEIAVMESRSLLRQPSRSDAQGKAERKRERQGERDQSRGQRVEPPAPSELGRTATMPEMPSSRSAVDKLKRVEVQGFLKDLGVEYSEKWTAEELKALLKQTLFSSTDEDSPRRHLKDLASQTKCWRYRIWQRGGACRTSLLRQRGRKSSLLGPMCWRRSSLPCSLCQATIPLLRIRLPVSVL